MKKIGLFIIPSFLIFGMAAQTPRVWTAELPSLNSAATMPSALAQAENPQKTAARIKKYLAQRTASLSTERERLAAEKQKQRRNLLELGEKIKNKIALYEKAGIPIEASNEAGLSEETRKTARENRRVLLAGANQEFQKLESDLNEK